MKAKRKPVQRTFCGILFTRQDMGRWKSESGIVLQRNHIGVKFEKWSVEEHPEGPQHRGTGSTIHEALKNSDLLADPKVLNKLKQEIRSAKRRLGAPGSYSPQVIGYTLKHIAEKFGKAVANQTIFDMGLDKCGWKPES
jgi:hypothetical protein